MKNELLLWKSANSLWYAQPTSDDTSLLRTLSKLIRRQKLLVLFSKKKRKLYWLRTVPWRLSEFSHYNYFSAHWRRLAAMRAVQFFALVRNLVRICGESTRTQTHRTWCVDCRAEASDREMWRYSWNRFFLARQQSWWGIPVKNILSDNVTGTVGKLAFVQVWE